MTEFNDKGAAPFATVDCEALLARLAEEEEALEHLLFKLREQHMVLSSGEHRWLGPSTREVEAAVRQLTAAGERREAVARTVHAAHGLPPGASLAGLAERVSDELTCQLLHQRQRSLRNVLDQVRRGSRQNRELLAHGLAATNDALALLGSVPTYDSAGGVDRSAGRPVRTFDTRV
jgi:hypothetical protein